MNRLCRCLAAFGLLIAALTAESQAQSLRDKIATSTISNTFYQTDLNQAIADVAFEAGVNIIVAAQPLAFTDAIIEDRPLLEALDMLLAGTGLVYEVKDQYIIVYDPREVDQIDGRNIADFYRPQHLSPSEARDLLPDELKPFSNASDSAGLINIYGPPPIVQNIKNRFLDYDVNGLNTEIIVTQNIPPSAIKTALPRNLASYLTFDNDSKQIILRGPKVLTDQIKFFINQMENNALQATLGTVPSAFEIYKPKALSPQDLLQLTPPDLRQYMQVTGTSDLITISAEPEIMRGILKVLHSIDLPPQQVLLSAKIISLSDRDLTDEGTDLSLPTIRVGTSFFRDLTETLFTPWAVGVGYSPSQEFSNALTLNLRMLESSERATILSSPSVAALNNQQAQISFSSEVSRAVEIPAAQDSDGKGAAIKALTGGTSLIITPKILGDNNIQLAIDVNVSDFDIAGANTGAIETSRAANTTVVVENGGTAIIAGLSSSKRGSYRSGLPGVYNMFTRNRQDSENIKLSILITAKILSANELDSPTNGVLMRMNRDHYAQLMQQALAHQGLSTGWK